MLKNLNQCVPALLAAALVIAGLEANCFADETPAGGEKPEVDFAVGRQLYQESCASCHGEKGQGVDGEYDEPLVGDSTVTELQSLISDTMPLDDPEACVGEDAEAVAQYMYDAFYSEAAQLRNAPPRVGIARLTGRQLRQSLAGLYGFNSWPAPRKEERGLTAIYFDGDRWKNENKKIERVDPVIDFDWGHESPGEGIKPKAFFIHWSGGIKPDVTGQYEIVVRSTCSFVMDLGANDREFINNHVQSGDKTEFRKKLILTAGRVAPIELQFRQRERSTELPPARVSLSWVPPGGTEQIIPTRNLVPGNFPSTYSLQIDLPPDDRSYGYERGISLDRQWDSSTTRAALEFADIVNEELWPRYQREHKKEEKEPRVLMKEFLAELIGVAFGGPLSEELQQVYIDQQLAATEDNAEAIKRSLLLALKSPRFLYTALDADQSPSRQAANRLTLTLHDSVAPDKWLIEAAEKEQLQTEEQIRNAARRLVDDYRTEAKMREMLHAWLNLGHVGEITKDEEAYPGFDAELVDDLRQSLDAVLDEIVWSEQSDFRQLFLADWTFTTDRIAAYYGEAFKPANEESERVLRRSVRDAKIHHGVLTHPYLMSGLAYTDSSSPIHRGIFLIRYALGRTLRPPNEAFTPFSPDLHPDLTTRERVALQTNDTSCQVCHSKINSLGFVLENYDAAGRFRLKERDRPVDTSGAYLSRADEEVTLEGPDALAKYLAESEDSHESFVDRAFQHFVKQPIAAYGPDQMDELTKRFRESGFNIRELLVEIAVIAAQQPRHTSQQET